jgi:hypothetical protein
MSDFDDVIESGRRQLERLNAAMAEANAQYQRAKIEGDVEGQDSALQDWSNLENQAVNLQNSYSRQIAAAQAAAPREPTQEEVLSKPITSMSHQELFDHLNKTSKYGADLESYKRGMDYVARSVRR